MALLPTHTRVALKDITNQLRDLAHDELVELANWCQSAAKAKDPAVIAENARQEAFWAERERIGKEKEAHNNKVLVVLKKMLKPGDTLKMNGCKDGLGLREFIRWAPHSSVEPDHQTFHLQGRKNQSGDHAHARQS